MRDVYRIAERNIGITSLYEDVHRLCAPYLAREAFPDFSVCTRQKDIDFEKQRMTEEERPGIDPEKISEGYLETLAVYRKIAEKMPAYDSVLVHGSCVAVEGRAFLFLAKSGTGKSTHTRLWREYLGDRAFMVNDDKPLLRVGENGAVVYGTPWDGKHHLSTNTAVPLKAVCILERAETNRIRPIDGNEAYPLLLQQVYRPMERDALRKTLVILDRLKSSVPLWRLGCNMDPEAARIAYDAMKGQ